MLRLRQLSDDDRQKIVQEAMTWIDVPYKLYGNDKSGVDCSHLVTSVYKNALDINLITDIRRRFLASQLYFALRVIPPEKLKMGDLVFYCREPRPSKRLVTSVAIYIGDNKVIHSGIRLRKVAIESIYDYPGLLLTHKNPDTLAQWLQEFCD